MSRSEGNQTMKLGQLIEYNMIILLLGKFCPKYGEEANFPDQFIIYEN